jgi:hypothetical protein
MQPGRLIRASGLAGAAVLALAAPTRAQGPLELAVKATYLTKFAAFVEWPPAGPPPQICVAGDDPFGAVLDQAVRGQTIDGKPATVVRLEKVEKGAPCAVLFLSPSRRQPVGEALEHVKGTAVLTVTDRAPDGERGMIDFVLKDNRVRFRIDAAEAEQSGLTISSKLLSLAVKP